MVRVVKKSLWIGLLNLLTVAAFNQTYILQQNFEGTFPPVGWTFTTGPNAAAGWTQGPTSPLIDPCVPQGAKTMTTQWASFYPNDAWAFTPGQNLMAGVTYTLTFQQCVKSPSNNKTESLKVTVGSSATPPGQVTVLMNMPTLTNTSPALRTATFTPSNSGTYYFAFHCYSIANQRYLSVDDVNISYTIVCTPTTTPVSASICQGDTYNFHGSLLNVPGTYYDTLQNIFGCDSILTLHLTVNTPSSQSLAASICQGDQYNFHGSLLNVPGVYYDTLQNVSGCDSVIQLTLTVNPSSSHSFTATICQGDQYNFNGTLLNAPGNYFDTLQNVHGCDSIVQLNLLVNSILTNSLTVSICQGSTYNFNGNIINSPGMYFDTLQTVSGCDSIIQLNLSVNSVLSYSFAVLICQGDAYNFQGNIINSPGVYVDTLQSISGCDSIVQLSLTVNPVSSHSFTAAICQGDVYNFHGGLLSVPGAYTDTLSNGSGCDSIVQLTLTVNPTAFSSSSAGVCQGDTFYFHGNPLTVSGTYYDTLQTILGCDSIVALNFTAHPLPNPVILNGGNFLYTGSFASYQWLLNNAPIGGANQQQHTPVSNGLYTVEVLDNNGCSQVSASHPFFQLGDDHITENEEEVMLFPNPAEEVLNIQVSGTELIHSVTVYSPEGKVLLEIFPAPSHAVQIPVDTLPAGVFIIHTRFGYKISVKKLIKNT